MLRKLTLVCALVALSACSVWPIGQDPYGLEVRRNANETMMALQAYHRDTGAFPVTLDGLVPKYLAALPDVPHIQYDRDAGSLSFRYTPSWPQLRPVWCNSVGNTTNWNCDEHML
ncbi:MAG TPA: hypothetical protein VN932_11205 [Rhizomicrobium sp.]|nr:hypothetical protein [Rhizomicrobium sp.]